MTYELLIKTGKKQKVDLFVCIEIGEKKLLNEEIERNALGPQVAMCGYFNLTEINWDFCLSHLKC